MYKRQGLDLSGVVIQGDLVLDELPAEKVRAVGDLAPEDRRVLEGMNDEEVHVIRGPFAVSYTHLDVYKRQFVHRLERPGGRVALDSLRPDRGY